MKITPSIQDVAERARVSPATVSLVLNGKGRISQETRRRVLEAVEVMGYTPDLRARSLKSQRIQTIALVFIYSEESLASSRFFRDLTMSVCAQASMRGYKVLVSLLSRNEPLPKQINKLRQDRLSGGLIVAGPSPEEVDLIANTVTNYPALIICARSDHDTCGFVDVDNAGAMQQAINHLLSLGHKRIAYVGPHGVQARSSHTVARRTEYQHAMTSLGLDYEYVCDLPVNDGADAEINRLLDARPTAVVTFDDLRSIQIINLLNDRGLQVPKDLAVIGFDDEDFGQHVSPRLTTIAQPFMEMGQLAAENLIQCIEDRTTGLAREVLPLNLIVRESSGMHTDLPAYTHIGGNHDTESSKGER